MLQEKPYKDKEEFIILFEFKGDLYLFNNSKFSKYRFYIKKKKNVKIKGLTIKEFIDNLIKYIYYIEFHLKHYKKIIDKQKNKKNGKV